MCISGTGAGVLVVEPKLRVKERGARDLNIDAPMAGRALVNAACSFVSCRHLRSNLVRFWVQEVLLVSQVFDTLITRFNSRSTRRVGLYLCALNEAGGQTFCISTGNLAASQCSSLAEGFFYARICTSSTVCSAWTSACTVRSERGGC